MMGNMNKPTYDMTTIGEIMLRLSVPSGYRLEAATQFDVAPAGAESNCAALLARLGRRAAFVTALPNTAPGRLAAHSLRAAGVDLDGVVWSTAGRMGVFYVEYAVPPRPIEVTYDRTGSCFAQMSPGAVDYERLLATRLLHLTGITPALSQNASTIVHHCAERARANGIPISFDVNYRRKLWPPEQARTALLPLMQDATLLFCAQADAREVFGLTGAAETLPEQLAELTGAIYVVVSAGETGIFAWDSSALIHEPAAPTQVIDRLGAGDALAAGVIHGWLAGDFRQGLRFGAMLAALALSQHGDLVITTADELNRLVEAGRGGQVAR